MPVTAVNSTDIKKKKNKKPAEKPSGKKGQEFAPAKHLESALTSCPWPFSVQLFKSPLPLSVTKWVKVGRLNEKRWQEGSFQGQTDEVTT